VFTNGIGIINALLQNEDVSVVVLCGRLRPMNETITGTEAENMLRSVVADYAFIGADGVHPHCGIASRTLEQSQMVTRIMQRAWQVVVVAESRKLCTDQFDHWSSFPARWLLITDDAADPATLNELRKTGAQVIPSCSAQPQRRDADSCGVTEFN
jgi:DeoR/GlpR family transcriptional regulator of sugar metabolism